MSADLIIQILIAVAPLLLAVLRARGNNLPFLNGLLDGLMKLKQPAPAPATPTDTPVEPSRPLLDALRKLIREEMAPPTK